VDRSGDDWVSRRVGANGVVCVSWQQVSVGKHHAGARCDVLVTDQLLKFRVGNELCKTIARTSRGEVGKKRASVPQSTNSVSPINRRHLVNHHPKLDSPTAGPTTRQYLGNWIPDSAPTAGDGATMKTRRKPGSGAQQASQPRPLRSMISRFCYPSDGPTCAPATSRRPACALGAGGAEVTDLDSEQSVTVMVGKGRHGRALTYGSKTADALRR
jgi:hypothetical protein